VATQLSAFLCIFLYPSRRSKHQLVGLSLIRNGLNIIEKAQRVSLKFSLVFIVCGAFNRCWLKLKNTLPKKKGKAKQERGKRKRTRVAMWQVSVATSGTTTQPQIHTHTHTHI